MLQLYYGFNNVCNGFIFCYSLSLWNYTVQFVLNEINMVVWDKKKEKKIDVTIFYFKET